MALIKYAPKQCHKKFDNLVISNGYKINDSYKCIYYKSNNDIFFAYMWMICLFFAQIFIL